MNNWVVELTKTQCEDIQSIGRTTINLDTLQIQIGPGINRIGVTKGVRYLKGRIKSDSHCETANFRIFKKEYKQNILKMEYHLNSYITLGKYIPDTKHIAISGIQVPAEKEISQDAILGTIIPNITQVPKDECEHMRNIYIGTAKLHSPRDEESLEIMPIVSFKTNEQSGAMALIQKSTICRRAVFQTTDPNIYVNIIEDKELTISHRILARNISVEEMSMLTILTAKTQENMLNQDVTLDDAFKSVSEYECNITREYRSNIINIMGMASPESLANFKFGILAMKTGGALTLITGKPLTAQLRQHSSGCCQEIPITVKASNGTQVNTFAYSISRVITPYCTKIQCNNIIQVKHLIERRPWDTHLENFRNIFRPGETHNELNSNWFCATNSGSLMPCAKPITLKAEHGKKHYKPGKGSMGNVYGKDMLQKLKLFIAGSTNRKATKLLQDLEDGSNGGEPSTLFTENLQNLNTIGKEAIRSIIAPNLAQLLGKAFPIIEAIIFIIIIYYLTFNLLNIYTRIQGLYKRTAEPTIREIAATIFMPHKGFSKPMLPNRAEDEINAIQIRITNLEKACRIEALEVKTDIHKLRRSLKEAKLKHNNETTIATLKEAE